MTEDLGFSLEVSQYLTELGDDRSGFSPEDLSSNAAGAEFGDDYMKDGDSSNKSEECQYNSSICS